MRRSLLIACVTGVIAIAGTVAWFSKVTTAEQPVRPPVIEPARPTVGPVVKAPVSPLPISQVYLFSSGVGYFQREGEVEGSARIDLLFPATDVNDLIKSLVLQDLNGGKINAVGYDSQDPIDRTLKSFALDLTYNPSFGQILNQARGEKVEVTLQQSNVTQPANLTGVVVGMESKQQYGPGDSSNDVEMLNLLCLEGLRSVNLAHVQRVRFLNPTLDAEFRRALEVLASGHNTQKKTVSLGFAGEGKRGVRVGYVIENPIWKTSYRLVLDKTGKPFLQGWAVVENTTDEDWQNVRMVLISGRPISYEMDLYQPLYIPRPKVEPELFASLRPPTYSGDLSNAGGAGNLGIGGGAGGMGNVDGNQTIINGSNTNRYQINGQFGNLGGGFGLQGGAGNLGGQFGLQGGFGQQGGVGGQNPKLTFEELKKRKEEQKQAKDEAKQVGNALAALDPVEGVTSVATAEEIGDYFQYAIDQKVSLARQKSAMLPIVNQAVEGTRVSIYNEAVQAKFPLLGLKFKNTSGQHLMQGPVTVYEGGTYAGDARIMDLQPNEERLLSYAIDLGTEVKAEGRSTPDQLVSVKVVKGTMQATNKVRQTRTYLVKNRSDQDRVLLIEHPVRSDWKLVTPEKPTERSREVYRFQVAVPAGKAIKHEVVEEQTRRDQLVLTSSDDKTVRFFFNSTISTPAVKDSLKKVLDLRTKLADTKRELAQQETKLKAIGEDQARLRANLDKVPPTSAAYKRYLEKFDTQETEIEKLQGQIQQHQETEKQQQKEYEDFLAGLSVE